MTKREKILAAIVGALLLVVCVGYIFHQINNTLGMRRRRVTQLENEIFNKQKLLIESEKAKQRLEAYRERSLPSNLQTARSLYKAWLLDRALEVGFEDPLVKPLPPRTRSDVYRSLAFTVSGRGDLKQVVEFLYKFYSADYLHRIQRFHAKRIAGTKQLDLTFTVEALSLPTATHDSLPDRPSKELAHKDLVAYMDTILARNLSGRPNSPPEIEPIGEKTTYPGQPIEFTVGARDPDKLDKLTYRLDSEELPGARLDPETGRFEWCPEEKGEYDVVLTVIDDGLPPRSASQTVKIRVTDPPPEPPPAPKPAPSFELAKFAYVTAITEADGRWQAWINLRTQGKTLKLYEGDRFTVGEVEVTVARIEPRSVEFVAQALDKRFVARLGQNLAEARAMPLDGG